MSNTVNIVYIGKKPFKKDTVCGTRTIFKQGEATPVPAELVQRFLDFPAVWVEEGEAKNFLERQKLLEEQAEKERLEREEAEKQAALDASMLIVVDGEEVDLAKYSSTQLNTFAEAHDLIIEGAKRPVAEYCKKVRDAFRALTADTGEE
jgi:hypothetical protein